VRYLLKDEAGRVVEAPEQMFRRVARIVAAAEKIYNEDALHWEEVFLRCSRRFVSCPIPRP